MTVPFWVIRNILYPYGAKQPKRKLWEEPRKEYGPYICQTVGCVTSLHTFRALRNGLWICRECDDRLTKERSEQQWIDRLVSDKSLVILTKSPKMGRVKFNISPLMGNLEEWEYRFWVGVKFRWATFAICRACRKGTNGGYAQRKLHYDEHKATEDPCTVRLVRAYNELKKVSKCVVCRGLTKAGRWGVPLCSEGCVDEWKFNQNARWIPLEIALRQSKPRVIELGGSKTSESSLNHLL